MSRRTTSQHQTSPSPQASSYNFPLVTSVPYPSNLVAIEIQRHANFPYIETVSQLLKTCSKCIFFQKKRKKLMHTELRMELGSSNIMTKQPSQSISCPIWPTFFEAQLLQSNNLIKLFQLGRMLRVYLPKTSWNSTSNAGTDRTTRWVA